MMWSTILCTMLLLVTNESTMTTLAQTDVPDPCNSSPCLNGGECIRTGSNSFRCNCASGLTGTTCDTLVDPCSSDPCKNGGSCSRTGANSFSCNCPDGFTGSRCENRDVPDPCDSFPCLNGGECIRTGSNSFTCNCASGLTGTTCNTLVDPCSSDPCKNGGSCSRTGANSFSCNCPDDFTGSRCENRGCVEDGVQYNVGDSIPDPDPCKRCECSEQGKICAIFACRPPNCEGSVKVPGTCCRYICPKELENRLGCPLISPPFGYLCPRPLTIRQCAYDSQCKGSAKCCENKCGGTACLDSPTKKKLCPAVPLAKCLRQDDFLCGIDSECPGKLKCCRTPCAGTKCTAPVKCKKNNSRWRGGDVTDGNTTCKRCNCRKIRRNKQLLLKFACEKNLSGINEVNGCCKLCSKLL